MNHLSPSVRKGPFTEEEEQIVVDFYLKHGSKWSLMAKLLKGRTDNEIKNFWHARARKRARRGLPIQCSQRDRRSNLQDSSAPPSMADAASPAMLSAIQTLESLSNLRERLSTMFIKLDRRFPIPPLLPLKVAQEVELDPIHGGGGGDGGGRRARCNEYLQSVVMGACQIRFR